MNVLKIITDYLKENEFDGLWDGEGECACELDDLAPCEMSPMRCNPGVRIECKCGDDCDFDIGERPSDAY